MDHIIKIAIDAMGGDNAPKSVIDGAKMMLERFSDIELHFYGNEQILQPLLDSLHKHQDSFCVVHTPDVVSPDESPASALRNGKTSSMRLAIDAVKNEAANVAVSAGNTGALMAISYYVLRTLPGIDRPALAAYIPTYKGRKLMLDLGANVDCTSNNLIHFAMMGEACARFSLNQERPSIALLNIGAEQIKGSDSIKAAAKFLSEQDWLNFIGYVEADTMLDGEADVIVSDGFAGNVAIKAMSGTAKMFYRNLKSAYGSTILSKIGFFLARTPVKKTLKSFDHRKYNGAMLMGLNGMVVKSHGSACANGFYSALKVAREVVLSDMNQVINERINELDLIS